MMKKLHLRNLSFIPLLGFASCVFGETKTSVDQSKNHRLFKRVVPKKAVSHEIGQAFCNVTENLQKSVKNKALTWNWGEVLEDKTKRLIDESNKSSFFAGLLKPKSSGDSDLKCGEMFKNEREKLQYFVQGSMIPVKPITLFSTQIPL